MDQREVGAGPGALKFEVLELGLLLLWLGSQGHIPA